MAIKCKDCGDVLETNTIPIECPNCGNKDIWKFRRVVDEIDEDKKEEVREWLEEHEIKEE